MATIISTKTSSVGGLSVTGDASGILQLASADGTTALTIDASQNVTFAGSVNTPNTFGFKNLLIDAGFTINQRGYVSAATLASGVYGHDRWKAGASGGDYSFTQLASNTQITIASGKSLIQVVEDKNVNGTSYVLSWTGTAQARYSVNSATPAGSYAASPIVITGQTAGSTMSVEFNTGTLSKPQLELGAVATSFDQRAYGTELALCQRYYQASRRYHAGCSTSSQDMTWLLPVFMRSAPTVLVVDFVGNVNKLTTSSGNNIAFNAGGVSTTTDSIIIQSNTLSAYVWYEFYTSLSAEL
jgi:hypothetical protein